MNTLKEKYYHFTGEVPVDFEVHPYFPLTDEEVARIRELTVEVDNVDGSPFTISSPIETRRIEELCHL